MKERYLEQLPQWYKEKEDCDLILTDDIDSLLSCAILEHVKGWHIEQVMLFKANGISEIRKDYLGATTNATNNAIGVDLALANGKCFDNHVTRMTYEDIGNPLSINPNNVREVYRGNYFKKYAASTVLLLWSLYDLPKTGLSDELMMVLLAIDSGYMGYYNDFFREHLRYYLVDMLDLPEFYECLSRHTKDEFEKVAKKYRLKEKIIMRKGLLQTEINIGLINVLLARYTDVEIVLPTVKFAKKKVFKDIGMGVEGRSNGRIKEILSDAYCYALTNKTFINYSEEIVE